MSSNIIRLPQIANPSIKEVFEDFLEEQCQRLKPKTYEKYVEVVGLLQDQLNSYAYEGLSETESALFDRHYKAEGEGHKEFCELFGPEKIIDNLYSFLGFFMISKAMAGVELKRAAGTVTRKLVKWLLEKGYVSEEAAHEGTRISAEAARELPKAERAAEIIFRDSDALRAEIHDLDDEEYLDFDHYTIAEVKPGSIWLNVFEKGEEQKMGPIPVPRKATELLREGWEISCSLGYIRGKWRIVEMGSVYPL